MNATEFKAKCLSLLDDIQESGEPLQITKRGKVVALVVRDSGTEEKPWLALRGKGSFTGDPLEPVVSAHDVVALR